MGRKNLGKEVKTRVPPSPPSRGTSAGKKKAARLPDKPSALIRLALRDLAKVEKSRSYVVDMSTWHHPNSKCRVCFAGAVMAGTLGAPIGSHLGPSHFLDAGKLYSLNSFRFGDITGGFCDLGMQLPADVPPVHYVPPYKDDSAGFHRAMRALAKDLAQHGF